MELSKTSQTRWERHHTIPISCAIYQLCFVFVKFVHKGAVDGSGVGNAGCGVHVDVHGE